MDREIISTFSRELAKRLDKPDTKKFTTKSFCRSAITQLAKGDISVISLYIVGNLKLEYTEHSAILI